MGPSGLPPLFIFILISDGFSLTVLSLTKKGRQHMKDNKKVFVVPDVIERNIFVIRGHKVMLSMQ